MKSLIWVHFPFNPVRRTFDCRAFCSLYQDLQFPVSESLGFVYSDPHLRWPLTFAKRDELLICRYISTSQMDYFSSPALESAANYSDYSSDVLSG